MQVNLTVEEFKEQVKIQLGDFSLEYHNELRS